MSESSRAIEYRRKMQAREVWRVQNQRSLAGSTAELLALEARYEPTAAFDWDPVALADLPPWDTDGREP